MQAVEFEAVSDQHTLRLPEQVRTVRSSAPCCAWTTAYREPQPQGKDRRRRKPAPQLAGSVTVHDDLLAPAVPEQDWDTLK